MRHYTCIVAIFLCSSAIAQIQGTVSSDAIKFPEPIQKAVNSSVCTTRFVEPDSSTSMSTVATQKEPYRYGVPIQTSWSLKDGKWTEIDGGRIWTISVGSKNAKTIDAVMTDVRIPDGAYIKVINKDGRHVFGPVTSENCPRSHRINAAFLEGDYATIMLYEPNERLNESSLTISNLVHGFAATSDFSGGQELSPCNVDIVCYPEYLSSSQGVVKIQGPQPGLAGSGALVMNTAKDFRPYILTAFHNLDLNDDGVLSSSEQAGCGTCSFWFNYRSTICDGTIVSNYSIYEGATYKASYNITDFLLMEINDSSIKVNPNIRWLGWSRSTNAPTSGACLHHPVGARMKISTIDTPFETSWYQGGGIATHWHVSFSDGIIQNGSSGGPLLDQNNRVVGQVHGGHDSGDMCNWTEGWFGKLSKSWNGGGTSSTRLKDWLDPTNSNVTFMDSARPLPYYIEGNTVPCGLEIYRVMNLSNGDQVAWSWLSSSNVPIDENSPSQNMCCVNNLGQAYIKNTLVATITNGGNTVAVVKKGLDTGATFTGTYEQEGKTLHIGTTDYFVPNRTPRTFKSGDSFTLYRGSKITLKSYNFNDATITSSSSKLVPYSHSGNNIEIDLPYYGTEHGYYTTVYFTGSYPSSCDKFKFSIDIYAPSHLPPALNGISALQHEHGKYNIAPVVCTQDGQVRRLELTDNMPWVLTIVNQSSGKIVLDTEVTRGTYTVATDGWTPGIYVINITMRGQSVTSKIIIRN